MPEAQLPNSLADLQGKLAQSFSLEELDDLCFGLNISHEEIVGKTIKARTRALVEYCQRRGRLSELIEKCREERPKVNWYELLIEHEISEQELIIGPLNRGDPSAIFQTSEPHCLPGLLYQDKLTKSEQQVRGRSHTFKAAISVIVLLVIVIILITTYVWWQDTKFLELYTFDDGTISGWQPQRLSEQSWKQAATDISVQPRERGGFALRGDFDFGLVNSSQFKDTNEVPRATFYVDNLKENNWSSYNFLIIEAKSDNQTSMDIHFSFFSEGCYYEFGPFENLNTQWEIYQFGLNRPNYKTCHESAEYDQWPVLAGVHRLDIIVEPNDPQSDWPTLKGAVLIDNVRLEK